MSMFGTPGQTPTTGGTISNGQAALIAIGAVLAITIFVLPGPPVAEAGNDGYWSPMLATIPSVVQIAVFVWLGKRYDWQSPYQYLPKLLGRWLGGLVKLLYAFLFLFIAASVSQEIAKVVGAISMPMTPPQAFVILTVLAAAYVAWLGIEAFGRLAQLILPLLLGVLLFIPVSLIPQLDLGYLLPILYEGWLPPLRGALAPIAMRGEAALLLAFMLPHLRVPRKALRTGVLVTCVIALFLALNAVTLISLLSPGEVARLSMPVLAAARLVRLTRGIEHIEFLILGPWTIALVLKVGLFVYFATVGVAAVARSQWRPYVLPTAVLAGALGSWMYPNSQTLAYVIGEVWPAYSITMILLLPLLLVAVSLVRGRPAKGDSDGSSGRDRAPGGRDTAKGGGRLRRRRPERNGQEAWS